MVKKLPCIEEVCNFAIATPRLIECIGGKDLESQQFIGEFDNNSAEEVFRNGRAFVSIFDSEPQSRS
jgi:hypothetical protein